MRDVALLSQPLSGERDAVQARQGSARGGNLARGGALLSAALHGTVILVFIVGLPTFVDPPANTVIPFEMVILEEDEPEPEPEPEPPIQQAEAVPEPVTPEPEPEPEPPAVQEKAEPEPEPEPAPPPPKAKPEPKKLAESPPPKPRRRPNIKVVLHDKQKKQAKPKPDQLTTILRNVERLRDQPKPRREQTASAQANRPTARRASVFEQIQMVRAVQDQLRRCWRIDPGVRDAEEIVVEIKVMLNPDGSVQRAEIVDVVRMIQDGYFRSAAENAKRAINRCSPFRLPPRKYDVWRQLTLRFDPREMFGT